MTVHMSWKQSLNSLLMVNAGSLCFKYGGSCTDAREVMATLDVRE